MGRGRGRERDIVLSGLLLARTINWGILGVIWQAPFWGSGGAR